MLWCQRTQNIGLTNVNLNPRYDHNAYDVGLSQTDGRMERQTEGQTDGRTNIMAIARRFVLRTHRTPKRIKQMNHAS